MLGANDKRHGLGGGHDERQALGAKYHGTEVGDDGFDDFGRQPRD